MSQFNHDISVVGVQNPNSNTYPADPKGPVAQVNELPAPPPKPKRIRRYWDVICRILVTLLLIGGIVGVIKAYEIKGPLTRGQKYAYNTFIILLTLLLAINMTIAHSQFIILIREGFIFTHPRHPSVRGYRYDAKFHKISGLRTSLSFMLRELRKETKHQGSLRATSIFVILWLAFNLAVAIAIALIGLTYSLDEGAIGRRQGIVSIVDTKHFYVDNNNMDIPETVTERFVSKLYADVSISYKNATPSEPGKDDDYQVEELEDGWRYNFRETDSSGNVMLRSDRYVKTSASCTALKIRSWDPETSTLEWTDLNGKLQQVVGISILAFRTVYISEITKTDGSIVTCDNKSPRCGWLGVVQIVDLKDFSNAWLYYCDSTVENVSGATIPQHEILDDVAIIAATSLSQNGLYDNYFQSFAYYMNKVRWGEIAYGDSRKIEMMVSRASAGCLAAMDQLNPRVLVPGQQPWAAVHLRVRWPRLIGVLVVIGCLQLIAATSSILWHRKHLHPSAESAAVAGGAQVAATPDPAQPYQQLNQNSPYLAYSVYTNVGPGVPHINSPGPNAYSMPPHS